jgi:hypothetical protein
MSRCRRGARIQHAAPIQRHAVPEYLNASCIQAAQWFLYIPRGSAAAQPRTSVQTHVPKLARSATR